MNSPLSATKKTTYLLNRWSGKGWVAIIYFAVLVYLQFQPLFRDLDYEYHAVTAILLFWLSASAVTIGVPKEKDLQKKNIYLFYDPAVRFSSRLVLISFVIFSVGSLLNPCCYWRGLSWFVCLPLTAAVAGLATGKIIDAMMNKWRFVILLSVALLSFFYNVAMIFHYPMVSAYSFFWGYFSGPVYDEGVSVDEILIIHRIMVLAIALVVLWVAKKIKQSESSNQRRKFIFLFILIFSFSAVLLHNGNFGIFKTEEDMQSELTAQRFTDHTHWYADTSIALSDLNRYAMLGEYHYRQLVNEMKLKNRQPVNLYLFRDQKQKKQLTGTGQTQIARIWDNAIYLHKGQVESSLRHEMIHILAQEFGHPLYGSLSAGLLEGLAVAFDWDDEELTAHQWARVVQLRNAMPDMQRLMNEKIFFTGATGLSYTLAGSFCRYLIERYSMDAFKRIYAGEAYEKVYGKSLNALLSEWQDFLTSVKTDSTDLALANALLRPSYMKRPCRHAVVDLLDQSLILYVNGDNEGALKKLQRALKLDSTRARTHWLYLEILLKSEQWFEAKKTVDRALRMENPHPWFLANMLLKKTDLSVICGDTLNAAEAYQQIADRFLFYDDIHLKSEIRKKMWMKNRDRKYPVYIESNGPISEETDSLLNLWNGKLYYDRGEWQSALSRFEQLKFQENQYEYWRYRWMGECYLRIGKWAQAADAFRSAAGYARGIAPASLMTQYESFCQWMLK